MPDNHPYNTSLRIQHIGPHENANLQISMGGERGNRTLGDFVFYRCHEFLVLLSKPYKHRA